ncbi:LOW QUALITY PROTEIN: hypothetical protein Cgig2_022953 [Carnegiea gigantea]|uniref:Cytochrome P450 n=1 Tax=Carnegiea gigantea TaxID=171969 RepID=A0A9Q1KC48_9CARY|nr:LOW QUALITY PROTEIN: hypothetical protein Cgig2_022953 [Carnegiea gigantea]
MEYSLTFSLLLFSFCVLSLYIYATRLRRCKCKICSSFVSGEWRERFQNLPDWYTHLLNNSPTKTIHIHVLNNTITAHPGNVEHMLRTRFDNYPKGRPMSAILGDLLGRGIFIVDGDHWRFQRKLASLELGSVSIRAYAREVLDHEIRARLVPSLVISPTSSNLVDLQDVFRRFSFDNICRFSFGIDPSGLGLGVGLMEAFDEASRLSAQRALHTCSLVWRAKRLFNVGSERRLRAAIRKVDVVAENIITERRRKGEEGRGVNKSDLLSRFMGSVADDKYLRDIVVSFLLAGRDTVASGLTIFFYLLTKNPEAEARIIEESDRVLGQQAQFEPACIIPNLEQMRDMQYLQAAVHESLRLFPPIQLDSKWAKDDDVLPDGTRVKKGTRVSYHPYAMGRMEEIWGSDCLEFRPERWLDDNGLFRPENPYRYPAGVRVCLGKEIALLAMKTVALALIRRFEIRLADPEWTPWFIPGLTATLHGGLPVVVRDRCLRR